MAIIPKIPWTGAIDRSRPSIISDPNTAYDLKNVRITDRGLKRIRGGFRSYYHTTDGELIGCNGATGSVITESDGVRGILPYQYGNTYRLLNIVASGMYYRTIGGYQRVDNSSVVSHPYQMMQYGESAIITAAHAAPDSVSVVHGIYIWNGANDVQLIDSAPLCRYVRTHYNRIIAAGSESDPMLWYTNFVGDPYAWSPSTTSDPDAGGYIAELPGSRSITGISPSQYTGFYISTVDALHYIAGRSPSEFQHRLVSDGMGGFGHRTMLNIRGSIVAWNDTDCHILSDTDRQGGVGSAETSAAIRDLYREVVHRLPDRFFSVDDYVNGQYVTFMPHIQRPYTVAMIWNYRYNSWTWFEIPFIVQAACVWGRGHDALMLLGNDNCLLGYLQDGQLKDLSGTDFVQDFNVRIQTQNITMGNDSSDVQVRSIGLLLNSHLNRRIPVTLRRIRDNVRDVAETIYVEGNPAHRDVTDSTFVLGSSPLSSREDVVISRSHRGGPAKYVQLTIEGKADDLGDLRLYGIFADVEPGASSV